MIALLNTGILTAAGEYKYTEITKEAAVSLLSNGFESFIGHDSTAAIINKITNIDVPVNRGSFEQGIGDTAVIFKLNGRLPFGVEPSVEEIEEMGYKFMQLERVA